MDNNQQSSDHDTVIEVKVLIQTVLTQMAEMRSQIKTLSDTVTGQINNLDVKTTNNHNGLELRVRALEDTKIQYAPLATSVPADIKAIKNDLDNNVKKDIQGLKDSKTEFMGGWKVITALGIFLVWLIGITIAIWNIIGHLPH